MARHPLPPRRSQAGAPTGSPATGQDAAPRSEELPDELVDSIDRAFRRLRKSMIRPPAGLVPVPALGRQLDIAKIFACEAVAELSETSATVSVKDVAALLDLDHSTVSRLLGEIEDDELLVRGVDPADRRRATLELTDLGRAVVADATAMSRFFTRILLEDWKRSDVEELTRLMTLLSITVHERIDILPELAIREFDRSRPPRPAESHEPAAASHPGPTPRRR